MLESPWDREEAVVEYNIWYNIISLNRLHAVIYTDICQMNQQKRTSFAVYSDSNLIYSKFWSTGITTKVEDSKIKAILRAISEVQQFIPPLITLLTVCSDSSYAIISIYNSKYSESENVNIVQQCLLNL